MNDEIKPPLIGPSPTAGNRPVATLALFTLAGPIIGYFVFVAAFPLIVSMPSRDPWGQWAASMFLVVFTPFILLSYVIGGVSAIATGMLMILADRFSPKSVPLVVLAPIAGILTSYIWGYFYFPRENREMVALTTIAGGGAALICYLIAKRLRYLGNQWTR